MDRGWVSLIGPERKRGSVTRTAATRARSTHARDTPAICELSTFPGLVALGAEGELFGRSGTVEVASDGTRRGGPGCDGSCSSTSHTSCLEHGHASYVDVVDASARALSDASRRDPGDRFCAWCSGAIAVTARSDAVYCSTRCRQAAHRFGKACATRERAAQPMRFAYADPPYPGLARRYYAGHPDYAGEVDHAELLSRLQQYDGWALSTSSRALPEVLALCVAAGHEVRVAAWFRGARPTASAWPLAAWEPVVFAGGRRLVSRDVGHDALICHSRPRRTDPGRVIGSKPARFIFWLFDLLGACPGDELDDLFPGSGRVTRAWELFAAAQDDASRRAGATRRNEAA